VSTWTRIRWAYFPALPTRNELITWWDDLVAVHVRGYCNDTPRRPDMTGGGYSFWRCADRRGHGGLHRSNNYVWNDAGKTSFAPVRPGELAARDQRGRHNALANTWSYRRAHGRWQEKRMQEIRAARPAGGGL
jgi:hypothetical protein